MKIAKQRYRRVPIGELKPHPRNPRRGDVSAIRESIEANDFYGTVIVQRSTGYIIAGRHRVLAAEEAGAAPTDRIPVIEVDVDDETALRVVLADNRSSDRAGYYDDALHELLRAVGDAQGTLDGTGWTIEEYRQLEAELAEIDGAVPLPSASTRLDQRADGRMILPYTGDELAEFARLVKKLGKVYGTLSEGPARGFQTIDPSDAARTVLECLRRATKN